MNAPKDVARWFLLASVGVGIGIAASVGAARADELKDARSALAAGQYDQAAQLFEKASALGYAEGRAGVGQVQLRRRQYEKAIETFQTAQKMDGNLALAHYGEGEALRRLERYAEAEPKLRRATELDRKFPEAQLALGDVLIHLGQHAKALEALNVGLNWGSKWRPRFLVLLGDAELARDSLRDAGIYYTQARQEAASDPMPRRALGGFYLKRGIPALAIPEFQAAVDLDSSDVDLHYALGQAFFYDKRYNEALDKLRYVVARDADFAPAQLALGNLYYLSGPADPRRYQDAIAPLERYTQLNPKDPRGWSLLGRDQYFLKQREAAVRNLEKAIGMGETAKEAYTVLARAYADGKEWDKSIAAYGKGDPNGTDMLKIGQMFAFRGSLEQADSVYRSVLERDSTSGDAKFAMVERAKLKFRAKDYEGSVAMLRRRIALDPASGEAYYYKGLSHKELKQLPDAITDLRQATVVTPAKGEYWFWFGLVADQMDSLATARSAFESSVAVDSTSKTAAIAWQRLGYRALVDKVLDRAIRCLDRSVAINDKDVQSWVWLGQAHQNSGNRARAIECYNRALMLAPTQPDALKGKKSLGA